MDWTGLAIFDRFGPNTGFMCRSAERDSEQPRQAPLVVPLGLIRSLTQKVSRSTTRRDSREAFHRDRHQTQSCFVIRVLA
jgi:hypothetical protein